MIFLGLEKPVPYSGMSIFDPTMANMVLNALNNYIQAMKDDYLRGREDLKEFNKNFGDFFSPILKDMEWYDLNVTGATRDFINGLYERGIDPLHSPEARAMISRWVNNMPTGKINLLKLSAAAANEYLRNRGKLEAEGKWDPEFEKFANKGLTLDNWDTDVNGMWTRTSPAELKTLKELTEDWYNNRTPEILNQLDVESFGMKYDPRYDYTGFADRHLLDIAAGETPGWNGSIYADYYRKLAENKVASLGKPYTQEDVEKQLLRDVATANREYKALKRDENQFAILAQKHADEVALENLKDRHIRARSGGNGNGSQNYLWSFAELVRRSGPTAIVGQQVQKYSDETLKKQLDEQLSFGKQVMKATDRKSYSDKGISMYKGKYGQNIYRRSDIVGYFVSMGYKPTEDGMSIIIPKKDINKLSSLKSLASRTAGYRSVNVNTQTKDLTDADVIVYTPSGNSYQAFMKNSRNEAHFEGTVRLIKYKRGDNTGELIRDANDNPVLDKANIKQQTLYFDSDIKSVKNDSRLGYLNAPKKQSIVNTQDSRHQNAINADKDVTDKIIKNTVYGSDAILSEEPGYANIP